MKTYQANVFLPGCLGPVKREVFLHEDVQPLRRALEALVLFTKPTKSNATALNNAHRILAETEEAK